MGRRPKKTVTPRGIEDRKKSFGKNLIVAAFLLTHGFIKTGLGRRISYLFIRTFGRKILGLAYAITASDLVPSPATPSNTAPRALFPRSSPPKGPYPSSSTMKPAWPGRIFFC
jgi:hypothetical protein